MNHEISKAHALILEAQAPVSPQAIPEIFRLHSLNDAHKLNLILNFMTEKHSAMIRFHSTTSDACLFNDN